MSATHAARLEGRAARVGRLRGRPARVGRLRGRAGHVGRLRDRATQVRGIRVRETAPEEPQRRDGSRFQSQGRPRRGGGSNHVKMMKRHVTAWPSVRWRRRVHKLCPAVCSFQWTAHARSGAMTRSEFQSKR